MQASRCCASLVQGLETSASTSFTSLTSFATSHIAVRRPSRTPLLHVVHTQNRAAHTRLKRSRRPRGRFARGPVARLPSRSIAAPAGGRTPAWRGSDSAGQRYPSSSGAARRLARAPASARAGDEGSALLAASSGSFAEPMGCFPVGGGGSQVADVSVMSWRVVDEFDQEAEIMRKGGRLTAAGGMTPGAIQGFWRLHDRRSRDLPRG